MNQLRVLAFVAAVLAAGGEVRAGLIASWSGNGNANDSGNGHNGTLVNGAGYDAGKFGQAFSLNGSNQYVEVPDHPVWAFGNTDFSIALWANFDSVRQDSFRQLPNVFIGHSPGPFNINKWVFYYDDDGYLMFLNGPGNTDNVNFLRSTQTFVPVLGQWHHFAVTRSSNTYTFYADGISLGTAVSTVPTPDATGPLTIGQAEGLGYFDGRLDEIQIYNNALSGSEVCAAWCRPRTHRSGGLVAARRVWLGGSTATQAIRPAVGEDGQSARRLGTSRPTGQRCEAFEITFSPRFEGSRCRQTSVLSPAIPEFWRIRLQKCFTALPTGGVQWVIRHEGAR